jgi:hypothetical protein
MTLNTRTCGQIVLALKDYGVRTVEYPGWRARTAKDRNGTPRLFSPYGQAVHHDAASEAMSDQQVLRLMVEGRVDLAGPLCNGWIDSDSTVYLIAAGNANHAGMNEIDVHLRLSKGQAPMGDARDDPDRDEMVGNPYLWGWECRNAGTGRDPWEQLDAMERACAAVADVLGLTPDQIAGHRELTARKIDPAGINMHTFRGDVWQIHHRHHEPPTKPTTGEEMFFASSQRDNHVWFFEPGRRTLISSVEDRAQISAAAGIPNKVAEVTDPTFQALCEGRTRIQ